MCIAICTHNRAVLLQRTLESLAQLTLPEIAVEALVVANACTDGTVALVKEAEAWLPMPLRVVEEMEPGLAAARNRALVEARGDIVIFLDDDVEVGPDWLIEHLRPYIEHNADLVGGQVDLCWGEVDPPDWLGPTALALLSACEHGPAAQRTQREGDIIGCNFSMRRSVPQAIGGFRGGLGRQGSQLLGAEETDFIRRALREGFTAWFNPAASIRHWVAAPRIEKDYLLRVAEGLGRSLVYIKEPWNARQVLRQVAGRPVMIARHLVGETVARLRGNTVEAFDHRLQRCLHVGGLLGTLTRVRGRSPVSPLPPVRNRAAGRATILR